MKAFTVLGLYLLFSFSLSAQNFKRNTDIYSFSFTNEGKMKLSLNGTQKLEPNSLREVTADKEIIVNYYQYLDSWLIYADNKVGDSLVNFENWSVSFKNSISFLRRGSKLICSELITVTDKQLFETDPNTGEQVELVDEMGYYQFEYSTKGGLFEIIDLNNGKSLFKKENVVLNNTYGDRMLLVSYEIQEGNKGIKEKYTLLDEQQKILFENLSLEELYLKDEYLSLLINQSKADQIFLKSPIEYFDKFHFLYNGKMGTSSVSQGVIQDPVYDFQFSGGMNYFVDKGVLQARDSRNNLNFTGKESIQMMFYPNDYYTEYFIDGKRHLFEGDIDYGSLAPAYGTSETILRWKDYLIYSAPYLPPFDYNSMVTFLPQESEMGTLLIYHEKSKKLIFKGYGYSILNFTDKGFLLRKVEMEFISGNYTGNVQYSYRLLDKEGNFISEIFSYDEFVKNSNLLLKLLPDGSSVVSCNEYFIAQTVLYLKDNKIGVFSEFNNWNKVPDMNWALMDFQSFIAFYDDKIMLDDSIIPYKGEKPYMKKIMFQMPFDHIQIGNRKIKKQAFSDEYVDYTGSIEFDLSDTSYLIESVEFKKDLVIQNYSGEVRPYSNYTYDEYGMDGWIETNMEGDTLYSANIMAKSGVFDKSSGNWLVPANYFRVVPTDKYFVASYFEFSNPKSMTKEEFSKSVADIKYVIYDKKGTEVARGNAETILKKTKVDVKKVKYTY